MWKEAKVYTIHLTEIVHQYDDAFATFLNEIRMGTCQNFQILDDCLGREFPKDGIVPVKLTPAKYRVDQFNIKELNSLPGQEKHYYSTDEGEQWTKFFDSIGCRLLAAKAPTGAAVNDAPLRARRRAAVAAGDH